ncbi:MAG: GAF domain-containing protein [Cyanobacteria bacterium P01_F01_bin.150]
MTSTPSSSFTQTDLYASTRSKELAASSNGNSSLGHHFPSSVELEQAKSAAIALAQHLEAKGELANKEVKQNVDHLSTLLTQLSQALPHSSSEAQAFNRIQELTSKLRSEWHKTTEPEQIFQIIVDNVRLALGQDRAMLVRLNDKHEGVVMAESLVTGWTPALAEVLPLSTFDEVGRQKIDAHALDDGEDITIQISTGATLSAYQRQLLDKFQVQSSIAYGVVLDDQLWGFLVVQSCQSEYQWTPFDWELLRQLSRELRGKLQPLELVDQSQQRLAQEKTLRNLVARILGETDLSRLYDVTVREVRRFLDADRVAVFQFYPDSGYDDGEFIAEDVVSAYPSAIAAKVHDHCFGNQYADKYRDGACQAVTDIHAADLSDCHIDILRQFDIRANLIVPLLKGDELWGLLCVHQCRGPRKWSEANIRFVQQVAAQFSIARQKAEYLEAIVRSAQRERTIASMIERILKTSDLQQIYDITVREVRRFLAADRVAVFQFYPDSGYDDGEFIAEDVVPGVASAMSAKVHDHCFGNQYVDKYRDGAIQAIADIHAAELSDCHVDILEQFDIQANLIVPLLKDDHLWGLLCAHQCRGPREWSEEDIQFVRQIASQFSIARKQAEYVEDIEIKTSRERSINRIIDQVRRVLDSDEIFATSTREIRKQLECDRVSIYRFEPDWSGVFVAESVNSSWKPLVGPGITTVWPDTYLQETQGGRYKEGESFSVPDIYEAGHADCHIDILEQFQVRAYLIIPIFQGPKLWGLLAAYQNSGPRSWTEAEQNLMEKVGIQMGILLRQTDSIEQTERQSNQLAKLAKDGEAGLRLINRIGSQVVDLASGDTSLQRILEFACRELCQSLKTDRVAIFRFNSDWSGRFISEHIQGNWVSLVDIQDTLMIGDTYVQDTQGGRYRNNEIFRVDDIHVEGHADYQIELLEKLQAKAYMIVPIFGDKHLWGLLGIYQNSGPRRWEDLEETVSAQVAAQIELALEQAAAAAALKKAAAREKMIRTVVDQIYKVKSIVEISQFLSHELRNYLGCDRAGIYQFNEDWSGAFIAESYSPGWASILELQNRLPQLRENISQCSAQQLGNVVKSNTQSSPLTDTYLQQTQGGIYSRGELYRVTNDIYQEGFSQCYINVLEQYQVRAYVIVAIYLNDQLWGLLAVYQNHGPREWTQEEIDLVVQMSQQFSLTIQQTDYVMQLQETSQQLQLLANREKADKESLQKQIVQMLVAVHPALEGDLTVRAPISESEVGTVADAYNNTIQSLRELVAQVKGAALQVRSTSQTSESAVSQLSQQTQQELHDIQRVLETIQSMVASSKVVSSSAEQMEQAVLRANQTVQEGDRAMNRTVEGILSIRKTVADTTKKIKRLGEASQKISKVVSLINNFTTQTNLLALNAAIEATRAGEYGQGFAVVADEVRSLSQQSAEATAEIERLVIDIQGETGAVSKAMDEGIQQVVKGTDLVNETRQSLNEIVQATGQISQLVDGITQAIQTQTQQSDSVIQNMDDLTDTAQHTFSKSEEMAIAFKTLLVTSETLQSSVEKFKVE